MKIIPLRNSELVALVDDDDFQRLSKYKWRLSNDGYVVRGGARELFLIHREVLATRKGFMVDHIDHNKLNNQKSNLRASTASQNQANRIKGYRRTYSSKFKGVCIYGNGQIVANIRVLGRRIYLGTFSSELIAAFSYDRAAEQYFGEFAYRNLHEMREETGA